MSPDVGARRVVLAVARAEELPTLVLVYRVHSVAGQRCVKKGPELKREGLERVTLAVLSDTPLITHAKRNNRAE